MDRHLLESLWGTGGQLPADQAGASGQARRVFLNGALQKPKVAPLRKAVPRQEPGPDLVEALVHGLSVLECWEASDVWLGNSVIAERSGLTRPTVSRLTAVLVELGYLARDASRRGHFRLTGETLGLGYGSALGSRAAVSVLTELSQLAHELDVYAAFSIRRLDKIQILENVPSPLHPDAVQADVGTLLPICRSVSGLAAISALPENQASDLLSHLRTHYGARWQVLDQHVNRTRTEYSSKGYCTSVAILSQHVGAIAVPIHAAGSEEVFVLACGMPAHEFYAERVERSIAPRMLDVVQSLNQTLSA